MKSYIKNTIALTLISSLVFVSCKNRNYSDYQEMETPVSTQDIKKGTIKQFVTTTGTAYASKTVELSTETAGRYKLKINPKTGITFKLGDMVEEGTVIIELEDKEFVNGVQYNSKELSLDLAEKEWEAQKILYKKGGVTLKDVTNAENSYINAKYALENAEISLSKLKIKSPFRGVIVDLPYFTEGNKVNSGEKVLQIMDYKKMYMEVKFSEKNIKNIKVGQEASITNYTLKEDTLKGRITQISPAVNPDTRSFNGYLEIFNPDNILRPGMFVKADIVTEKKKDIIVIPKNVIINSPRGKIVYIVERNRSVEKLIETGLESDNEIEVVSGLEPNQRLIVSGYEMLHNNSRIKILK